MPDGSSSDAPVMTPGPTLRTNPSHPFDSVATKRPYPAIDMHKRFDGGGRTGMFVRASSRWEREASPMGEQRYPVQGELDLASASALQEQLSLLVDQSSDDL